jgi:hypothetical protein
MGSSSALEGLQRKQSLIQDRVRLVGLGKSTGVYLHSRPGLSKTYLVETTLKRTGVPYVYTNGHITPRALFDTIEGHPTEVLVLDDVSQIFKQPEAKQILLAALGHRPTEAKPRTVDYKRAGKSVSVEFTGGIIAISNQPLAGHGDGVLAALSDRVSVLHYDPSDEEVAAQIYDLARNGLLGLTPAECAEVAEFLLEACRNAGVRHSIRMYLDKALPDFCSWKAGLTSLHWKDLVRSGVQEAVIAPKEALRSMPLKERMKVEQMIVRDICDTFPDRKNRLQAWHDRTGKGQATFYRRQRYWDFSKGMPGQSFLPEG